MVKPKMTKVQCLGCDDDFYNNKNPHGVKECWMFKGAKMVKRKAVHVDQRPPWKQKAQWVPTCYHEPRYIYVGPAVNC